MIITIATFLLIHYFYIWALLLPLAPVLYARAGLSTIDLIIAITGILSLLLNLLLRVEKGEKSIEIEEVIEEEYRDKISRIFFVIFYLYSLLAPVNALTQTIRWIMLLPFLFNYESLYFNPLIEASGVKAYRARIKGGDVVIIITLFKWIKAGSTIKAKRAGLSLWVRTGGWFDQG